jgi:uracil-DNA glycosylase
MPRDAAARQAAQPTLDALLAEIRACRICAAHLPLGPRPVVRAGATARLLIVGQAPGTKVHETGIPWNDPSGDRLRHWLALDRDTFYDESRIAIIPAGFCYPGRFERGGDRPPRPECAPHWHGRLRALLPDVELTLLVGQYAQAFYLGNRRKESLTETVRHWRDYLPAYLPTPHPSWRSINWLRRNPWFDAEVVPELRRRVAALTGRVESQTALAPRRPMA